MIEIPNSGTRPTSVMLRRRLFDKLQDITEFSFVDLCAGSGSVGIEAISRGVKGATFIDIGKKQTALISKNLNRLKDRGCSTPFSVRCMSALKWLELNINNLEANTILFFDPPYNEKALYEDFFSLINLADKNILFLVELSNKVPFYNDILKLADGENLQTLSQGDRTIFWF